MESEVKWSEVKWQYVQNEGVVYMYLTYLTSG